MNKYLKIGLVFIISFLLTYLVISLLDNYDNKKQEEENKKK
jgi:preprotein translocase subunit SecG